MMIRDRIKELRRVEASRLRPHPRNWRTHPERQQEAMRGILAEVGYADALLARELSDGTLELIDGHLRAETTPDMEVPVLILDLDDTETAKLLTLHDPLAGMADTDEDVLAGLVEELDTESDAIRNLLDELLAQPDVAPLPSEAEVPPPIDIPEAFQVVVECKDEAEQQVVFQRMADDGFKCRLLTL